ncbi:MAG: phosphatase [Blastopirellula sp.]|nr:MAG: phosphatase [Blastopirellula sp.]
MNIKALIFDVDGTLAETEEAHREAFNDTFKVNGMDWCWDVPTYKELLKTTGGKERMLEYQRVYRPGNVQLKFKQIAKLHIQKTKLYGDLIAKGAVNLRAGISDLINDAKANGIRLAVATTTNRPNVDCLSLVCFDRPATDVFEVIAAGDEVQNKKPAPDVFNLAVERLRLEPSECVGLEDSRNGLLSCIDAGILCVVSPGVYTRGSDFSEARATINCFSEVDTIEKLKAALGPKN